MIYLIYLIVIILAFLFGWFTAIVMLSYKLSSDKK